MSEHLLNLEHSVWAAVCGKDGGALRDLFSDDYIEITLEGVRTDKESIAELSPQVDEIDAYEIGSARTINLADDCVLLSYRLTIDGRCRGEAISPRQRWATSVWRQTVGRNCDGKWQCCFYQQSAFGPERVK